MTTLISQGAEAKIHLVKDSMPQPNQKNKRGYSIIKDRTPKSYRHRALDNQIRTRRTKSEAKILTKAKEAKVNVPTLIHTTKHILTIEHIKGDRLSQTLNSYPEKKQLSSMQKLGRQLAKLHQNNIIHSDLTTSNTILSNNKVSVQKRTKRERAELVSPKRSSEGNARVFLIDFGLSYISTKTEDKAVDLHLIKQALEAKHHKNHKKLFTAFKKGYNWKDSKKILERLITVESRGRYKH